MLLPTALKLQAPICRTISSLLSSAAPHARKDSPSQTHATCTLSASIAAHARGINALEVHPLRDDLFVTASEDTTIGVWKCDERSGGKILHCTHIAATDWLLTGLGFVGGADRSHVVASAYDHAALQAWRIDSM